MGILSSIFGAKALKKANKNALAAQTEAYNEASAMYDPFKQAGDKSLKFYNDAIGIGDSNAAITNFQNSPLYRLQYDAAMKAGQTGTAGMGNAAGMRNSGRTLMALQDNARNITNQTFGQYVNPLASGASTGLGVTGTLADMRLGQGQNLANYSMNKGQIKAGQMAGFDGLISDAVKMAGKFATGGFGGFGGGSGSLY